MRVWRQSGVRGWDGGACGWGDGRTHYQVTTVTNIRSHRGVSLSCRGRPRRSHTGPTRAPHTSPTQQPHKTQSYVAPRATHRHVQLPDLHGDVTSGVVVVHLTLQNQGGVGACHGEEGGGGGRGGLECVHVVAPVKGATGGGTGGVAPLPGYGTAPRREDHSAERVSGEFARLVRRVLSV